MRRRGKREAAATASNKQPAVHPVFILIAIIAVTVILLGLVNHFTAARIEGIREERAYRSMLAVLPAADIFTPVPYTGNKVEALYGAYSGTELLGHVAAVTAHGFGGEISMTVGVDLDGKVTGVDIVSHSETPGVGSAVTEQDFLSRFVGKSGTVTVNAGGNRIDAVTGATLSSKAVAAGVNAALSAVASLG